MTEKVLLTVKTDRTLKEKAQQVARELGVPLGTIINAQLRRLVVERSVTFEVMPKPNAATRKAIAAVERDLKTSKHITGPFDSVERAAAYLDAL